MLLVVMHNRRDYLEAVVSLMKREDIVDVTIVESEGLGGSLIGPEASFFFGRGQLKKEYDKAVISVVRGEDKARCIVKLIDEDPGMRFLNLMDKGFLCSIPFSWVKGLELESSRIKRGEAEMKVLKHLNKDLIRLDLKASRREEAIRELGEAMQGVRGVKDQGRFMNDVIDRERLGTTGIGNGVAIPHARSDAVDRLVIAFGRSRKGVEFDSLDGKPATLIFLMGTPTSNVQPYLRTLAHLSRLLQKEEMRNSLLEAKDASGIMKVFKVYEG